MLNKRGQISTEYIMVVAFVLFIVLTALGIAFSYSSQIKDTMKFNQLENLVQKVTAQAESIFYAGQPSRTTIKAYFPEGINNITISDYYITVNISTSTGESINSYKSNVNLTGSLKTNAGVRIIYLNATDNAVIISG